MSDEILAGGNSNTVARVGGTVRRAVGPWTPAVHALLRTLRDAGIHEVPEPLGFDELGREVLSYLPGDVGNYPLPDWLWEPAIVRDAGSLLRRVHDASVPLVERDLTWGFPRRSPAEVICHNDVAPYNMTFEAGRVTGLFDFDTASPGPRIWDLAYLAYRLVPFGEDSGTDFAPEARFGRLDLLVEAYGITFDRTDLLRTIGARLRALAAFTERRLAETGRDEFSEHAAMYRRDAARIETLIQQSK